MDGLKLYEELLDDIEVSKLLSLVNDLRASGKRGQLQGKFLFFLTQLDYIYVTLRKLIIIFFKEVIKINFN